MASLLGHLKRPTKWEIKLHENVGEREAAQKQLACAVPSACGAACQAHVRPERRPVSWKPVSSREGSRSKRLAGPGHTEPGASGLWLLLCGFQQRHHDLTEALEGPSGCWVGKRLWRGLRGHGGLIMLGE